jgi:hypothetical protein
MESQAGNSLAREVALSQGRIRNQCYRSWLQTRESTPRFELVYNRAREGELKLDTAIDDRGQVPCRTRSAAESISLVALETVGTETSAKRI